jgi:hypothetical protein
VTWLGDNSDGLPQQSDGVVCGYAVIDLLRMNLSHGSPFRVFRAVPDIKDIAKAILESLIKNALVFFNGKKYIH